MNSSDYYQLTYDLQTRRVALKTIESTVAGLVITAAFVGNTLVCWTLYRHSMLSKVPNYYVCALTISDLLFASCVFPFVLGVSATGRWPFSDMACQFQGYMSMWMAYASILTITLTAMNRFFKVVKPNLYRKFYTPRKTVASILAVWILAGVGALPHLLLGNKYVFHPGKMLCLFDLDKADLIYTFAVAFIYFGIPLTIIVASYWMIFRFARSQNSVFSSAKGSGGATLNRTEINITRVLFAILVAFFFCYIQIAVIDMIETLYKQFSQPRQVYVFYSVMAGLASCLNPVIYGVMNPTFRREFRKILCFQRMQHRDNKVSSMSQSENTGGFPARKSRTTAF